MMDFMKIFKRQKSVGKKDNSLSDISDDLSDLKFDKAPEVAKPCDLNLNLKEGKSWRKSLRKSFRKRKDIQSNSCDNILQHDSSNAPLHDDDVSARQTNRWSYSPDHTGSTFDPVLINNSLLSRRHTEGGVLVDDMLRRNHDAKHKSYDFSFNTGNSTNAHISAAYNTANHFEADHSFIAQPEIQNRYDDRHRMSYGETQLEENEMEYRTRNMSTFKDTATPLSPGTEIYSPTSSGYLTPRKFDFQPHSTLFEHKAESALNRFEQHQDQESDTQYEEMNTDENIENLPENEQNHEYTDIDDTNMNPNILPVAAAVAVGDGDDISWGSQEFEPDSEDDTYDNDMIDEGMRKNQSDEKPSFFRKNREFSKEFSEGVKKLKFLQRKTSNALTKKNSREEDPSLFIDVKLTKERHPGPHLRTPPPDLKPYQSKRRNIVKTIIGSESSFIDSLERLEISYKKALLDARPQIISSELIDKIFYKIAEILQCHQLFQIALTSAVNDWDEHETIGDTFVASFSKVMVLECYSSYINNFTSAMETVRKTCKQKPQFLTFLRDRQNESNNRLNLYGLMLKPVQRFPQFILLVQDLLKHTPHEHADRLALQLALTELETLAENLNQRRADDEEKSAMIQLLDLSNIKLTSNLTKDGRTRRLLKQGNVREQTFDDDGNIEKDRECLLILTNDMLLCCNSSNRRQQPRSGIATFRDLYKLKWCTTLDILTILDGHDVAATTDYKKMKTDLATLEEICTLIESLHHPQQNLTVQQVEPSIRFLEAKIKQIELSNHDSSDVSFSVHFQQKSTDFKRTLVMPDNQHCNDWLESIINSKLANDSKNLHCWFSADGSDSEYLWRPPLFLESVKCQDKPLQVQCAFAFMPASHITLLWFACSASTVVSIVNVYKIYNERIEKVYVMQVESSVQCMEYWNPNQESPSVWLGMECGSLVEFNAEGSYSKLCEVTMPTMSTVMIMKAYERNLYVGLLDGSLLMYTRSEGMTDLVHVQSITVGNGPLNCLSPLDGKLWGASGNDIVTIDLEDFKIVSMRTIPTEESLTVSHVVQVGSGLWVAFCDTCSLQLYHLDSLKLLQDINLSRPIRDFFQGLGWTSRVNETCFITSLWSSYWQLLVGTSNGLIMTMPLPKLSGSVPKITGPCRICYHMLGGPVTFLCAPAMPAPKPKENISEMVKHEDGDNDDEEDRPPDIPERSPMKPTHGGFGLFKHKRTSSEGLPSLSDIFPASSLTKTTKNRFSVAEPVTHSHRNSGELIPPALPPKPNTPPKTDEIVAENLLEDDFVFKEMETLPSPSHTIEKQFTGSRARNFPVLLACGEGYKYSGRGGVGHFTESAQRATNILSWKIVL